MLKYLLIILIISSAVYSQPATGTESLQQDTLFSDHFENLNNWTIVGPLGMNNWYIQSTSFSGGIAPPELVFSWSPLFIGDSYVLSPVITGIANHNLELIFTYSIDWWSNTMYVGIATTSDGGNSYSSIWEFGATTSYPPVTDTIYFTGVDSMQLALYYTGDSNDADFWYIDDLFLIDLTIVPVELTSFIAVLTGGIITLSWSTATETNNQGFQIERSNGGEFTSVGYVAGHGTTTETQNYIFTDRDVPVGSYSYRLKQVDFDGTFEYSDVVEAEVAAPVEFALDQNYPNPFNPSTKITFRLAADSKVSLKVFDVLGQEVITLINNDLSAGSHQVDFDASNLNSGVYFYKIEATANNPANGTSGTNFNEVKKMVLTK